MVKPIFFTKDELCLLISALASYIEHSSLKAILDFDKVYLYTSDIDFDNHLKFLSRNHDLQKRLIDILNNYE